MFEFRSIARGWYRLYEFTLRYRISTYRNLLDLIDGQLAKDFQEWERQIEETDYLFEDDDHVQWEVDNITNGFAERERYTAIFLSSFFASSFALLEHELVQVCELARMQTKSPFSVKDFGGRDYMENAKKYLKRLGVKVTADSSEWTHATNYRTIRNKIMHEGGRLGQSDSIVGFAAENGILVDTPLLGEDRELSLCMTREFCRKALNDMETVLLQVGNAYYQWLQDRERSISESTDFLVGEG